MTRRSMSTSFFAAGSERIAKRGAKEQTEKSLPDWEAFVFRVNRKVFSGVAGI